MGDPRKLRKKYQKPSHPWQKERIEQEKQILKDYGLKNKKEIWKSNSILRSFTSQAKKLAASQSAQGKKERELLMNKLQRYGFIKPGAMLDDVLGISLKDILERRLQTLTFKKGLAHSMKQARQFIVHQHIKIGDKKMTVPSYLVTLEEETTITFSPSSTLADPEHPERTLPQKQAVQQAVPEQKEEKQHAKHAKAEAKTEAKSEAKPVEASA